MANIAQIAATLLTAAQVYGPWLVLLLIVVLFLRVILDEDRSSAWRARFYRSAFAVLGKTSLEKKYIANDVRAKLNLARRRMQFARQILPRAVDVHWIESGHGQTVDVGEGQYVVRLDPSECQERNISLLANAIVRRTSLLGIRHVVDASLELAIDLNIAKRLVEATGNRHVYDWFIANEYQATMSASDDVRAANRSIATIDERGLFTRLLLVELDEFSKRIFGLPPKPLMRTEIRGLVDFLYRIASREYGEEVPLSFLGSYVRIGLVLVARTGKILVSVEPYVRALDREFRRHANSVYVLVFDKDWLGQQDVEAHRLFEAQLKGLVMDLDRHAGKPDLDLKYTCADVNGVQRQARCIRYIVRD
jgi:hypothetical protein